MYNRHPRKAIDHELGTASDDVASSTDTTYSEDILEELLDMREKYHARARDNIQKAQQKQKEYYDARHNSNHVSVPRGGRICMTL